MYQEHFGVLRSAFRGYPYILDILKLIEDSWRNISAGMFSEQFLDKVDSVWRAK